MPPSDDVIASCSFCGKADTAVSRIVAGPGVYICNECVDLAATIIRDSEPTTPEDSARRRSLYRDRPTGDILATIPALVRSADRVESELSGWIARLRERGTSWQDIADAAGMTPLAARRRFEGDAPG